MHLKFKISSVLAFLFCGFYQASAQDFYMPPDRPPPADYDIQGEYVGTITGGSKLGAWVISHGSMRFDVVLLPGGLLELPNDSADGGGWNRTSRFTANNITLSGTAFTATLSGGYAVQSITGSGSDRVLNGTFNGQAFALKHVLRKSPTQGLRPEGKSWSTGYASWFDDKTATADLSKWKKRDDDPQLKYGNYLFRGCQSSGNIATAYLHIEFKVPFVPGASGQNRGNSGIYLRGMHEMQVLDSFGLTGADNEVGAIYRVKAPIVNACLPPLSWNTYDIWYTAGSGTNGTFTVYANGVLVQDKSVVTVTTEAGFQGTTLYLQNHGNEVIFNNIWMIPNATLATVTPENVIPPPPTSLFQQVPRVRKQTSYGLLELGKSLDLLGRKTIKQGHHTLTIIP